MNREQLCQLLGWLQVPKESEMLGRGQHSVLLDRIETIVQQAVLAEREACARVVEQLGRGHSAPFAEYDCAEAIRARGEK